VRILIILLLLYGPTGFAQKKERPYVILVSFDGFRHDYVAKYDLPNFKAFIKNGAAAEALIPSFPSKTFPNHYTIVTGLYPGNHGLVDNNFYDADLKVRYTMRERMLVQNPAFYGGTPLWQLAQQQGLSAASCFWVGSEAPVQGEYPTYYYAYEHDLPNDERINRVLNWLKLPENKRPKFISLYFSLVDSEGHATGPNSEELIQTVKEADRLLGALMSALKRVKLPVNVIVVSDHGMMELKQEEKTWITLSRYFNTADSSLMVVNSGTHAFVYTSRADSLVRVLKTQEENFVVYKKEDTPEHWHYQHERVGDVLILANPGYQLQIASRNFGMNPAAPSVFGVHGYDPYAVKEMHGIFYARGPNIMKGKQIPAFENVHIYPLITKILRLKSPDIDGDAKVLRAIYKE
jgi:predicted AlkP superfamily pyrophosphatase or phosphodiesterase